MADVNTTQTTTVVEASRLVRLSYAQTIAALDDQALLSRTVGESQGSSNNFSSVDPGSPGFLGIGAEGSSSVNSSFIDSGWSISRTWLETYWDKIRWAIGIKDIGVFAFKYALASEIVSIPYSSPKPIQKVSLMVDEQIPTDYPQTLRWIQYFITPDNGLNWYRINPLDQPTLFLDSSGFPVPRILNFNSDTFSQDDENKFIKTTAPIYNVRLRCILMRPNTEEFSNSSPILKSYRLKIFPREGLV